MSIDWLTVSAQLLNFLVLVWLLKRFLYRPILDGIDAREQEIAGRMGEAAGVKAEALNTLREYERQIKALERQSSDTLAHAKAAAERKRDEILTEVRLRIETEQQALKHQRQEQAQQFVHNLNKQSGIVLLNMIQKILSDLSDETLEERLVLHALTTLQKDCTDQSVAPYTTSTTDASIESSTSDSATVSTHNPLNDECKQRIRNSVHAHWPTISLTFSSNPKQSPGALIQLGSKQVDWTIDTYITDLADILTSQLSRDSDLIA